MSAGERLSLNGLLPSSGLTGSDTEARHAEARPGEVRHSQADISLAREELGYRPDVSTEGGSAARRGVVQGLVVAARGRTYRLLVSAATVA